MAGPIGEHNIHEYLTAFADGELDASAILSVLDYLAAHPEGLELMRNQQRLRVAAGRAVRAGAPPVPAALRQRIESLASASTAAVPRPPAGPRPSRWRIPLVAAAFLLAGLLAGRWVLAPKPTTPVVVAPARDPIVPVSLVVQASRVHADCSRLTAGLHAAGYPKEMSGLSRAVQEDLGSDNPYPDLSDIGFEYVGAGPCSAPLQNTIHLLYLSKDRAKHKAVSVFVQPNTGQFELRPGNLYLLSGPRSTFPVFAWRSDSVVYFLVTDDPDTADKARELIAGSPNPPAVQE